MKSRQKMKFSGLLFILLQNAQPSEASNLFHNFKSPRNSFIPLIYDFATFIEQKNRLSFKRRTPHVDFFGSTQTFHPPQPVELKLSIFF